MKKNKRRLVAAILSCCMLLGTTGVAYAEESAESSNTTENSSEVSGDSDVIDSSEEVVVEELADVQEGTEELTSVDENGDVTIIDKKEMEDGVVEEPQGKVRTISEETKIVNFRANKAGEAIPTNQTTSYIEYITGNSGYVNGVAGADAAYLGTTNGKVKFMISGVIGLVDENKVQVVTLKSVSSFSNYYADGTNLLHRISMNMAASEYGSTVNVGPQPSYLTAGTTYYSYDGHYFYTDYEVMLSDYCSDKRSNAVNAGNPYYNYFQYLPLRSASGYSADTLGQIVNANVSSSSKLYNTGSTFVEKQNAYGTNALLVFSFAALESGWGNSAIAQTKNNLFGWDAVDQTPGESAKYFASISTCIDEHTRKNLSQKYLRPGYEYYRGAFLGDKASGMNVHYASDPYWGEKIASIAWRIDNANGKNDQYKFKLGIKDNVTYSHVDLNVRKEASTSSTVLYKTRNNSNYAFIILGEENGFYKVQSDAVLNSTRTAIVSDVGNYNASAMYAYASKNYVNIICNGSGGNSDVITGGDTGDTSGGNNTENIKLPFTDVSEDAWYYDVVKYVYAEGIMTGLNETTFGPAVLLSRAQFATIMYRIEGKPTVAYTNRFKDIAKGIWYTDAAIWAANAGVITGYENGLFGPADNITREQMAVILYRYAGYKGYDNSQRKNISAYSDAWKVSGFSKEAMQWAVAVGIISGKSDGKILEPQGSASRAECGTMIMRFRNVYGN